MRCCSTMIVNCSRRDFKKQKIWKIFEKIHVIRFYTLKYIRHGVTPEQPSTYSNTRRRTEEERMQIFAGNPLCMISRTLSKFLCQKNYNCERTKWIRILGEGLTRQLEEDWYFT